MDENLIRFIRDIQPMYDGTLGEIQREALAANAPIIPPETARLLSVILTIRPPERVLEIGAAVGFSASLIASYLKEGGDVTTIDRFDVMIKDAKKNISRMGFDDRITLLEGDAADILPTLTGQYDVVFLDAAKAQYLRFLPYITKLLKKGGIFIADDVLQDGDIAKSRFEVPRRQRTIHKRMRNFLWEITHSDVFESAILPIGGGVALCCKVAEKENDDEN